MNKEILIMAIVLNFFLTVLILFDLIRFDVALLSIFGNLVLYITAWDRGGKQ